MVLPYISMNPPQVYMCSPSWTPLPYPFPCHPSGSPQCTSPKHPVSCIFYTFKSIILKLEVTLPITILMYTLSMVHWQFFVFNLFRREDDIFKIQSLTSIENYSETNVFFHSCIHSVYSIVYSWFIQQRSIDCISSTVVGVIQTNKMKILECFYKWFHCLTQCDLSSN